MTKTCNSCGIEKDLDGFSKAKNGALGRRGVCRDCTSIKMKEYRKRPEVKEAKKIYGEKYRKDNPTYQQEYYQKNKEKVNKTTKKYYQKNKDKMVRWQKGHHLKKKYGITLDTYEEMLDMQMGRCKICNNTLDIENSMSALGPALDHCHKTGKVRGILCHMCNRGIGCFSDNPEIVLKAVNYLNENES